MDAPETIEDRVMQLIHSERMYGAASAMTQQRFASRLGTTTRKLQEATANLLRRGEPVVSSCRPPYGIFLAINDEEFAQYDGQLYSRIRGDALRLRDLRKIQRQRIATRSVEPNGQRRLFA